MTAAWVLAGRGVRKTLRTPQVVFFATVQGVAFLLIFRFVFGGAIATGRLAYVDFMVPALITTGVVFSGMGAAAGVAEDVQQGFFDRLRSLPAGSGAAIAGRVLADTALIAWVVAATAAVGFAVGFRVHGPWWAVPAGFGLCLAFGFAFGWVFTSIGLITGNVQAASGLGFLVLPLSFASSAFVPVATMPGWLRWFAENQPLSVMINAVRAVTQGPPAEALLGHDATWFVLRALLWAAAIVLVFAPLSMTLFRRRR